MLINIKHMSEEAKSRILGVFEREDILDQVNMEENGDSISEDFDLLPS